MKRDPGPYIELISDPTEENLGQLLDKLLEALAAERGCLWVESERKVIYRGNEELKMAYPFSRQVVLAAVKAPLGLVSFDVEQDDRLEPTESITAANIRSCLCAPARNEDGKILAVIYFDDKTTRGIFSEDELEFMVNLMAHYPGAVAHQD